LNPNSMSSSKLTPRKSYKGYKKGNNNGTSVMMKTVAQSAAINGVKVASLLPLIPTAAQLGSIFASLGDFINMYELFKIDKISVEAVPTNNQAGGFPAPWILGYVPFGGNNPTDATSFEGPHSSRIAFAQEGLAGQGPLTDRQATTLTLKSAALTLLQAAVGSAIGWIATNGLGGGQTSLGTIWWASTVAATVAANFLDVQIKGWFSFRDLYDPTQLRKNSFVFGMLGKWPTEHGDDDVILLLQFERSEIQSMVRDFVKNRASHASFLIEHPTPAPMSSNLTSYAPVSSPASLFSPGELERLRGMLSAQRPV